MKILFYFPFLFLFFSCGQDPCIKKNADSIKIADSLYSQKNIPKHLDSIEGDFDGDGKKEFAVLEMSKAGNTNLIASNDRAAEFKVVFKNGNIFPLDVPCCDNRLVKEGDLDGDGADEISVFNNQGNGCSYLMFTYSLKNGNWKELMEPFFVTTSCDPISDAELQARVFRQSGKIYFLRDVGEWKLIRTIAVMKK